MFAQQHNTALTAGGLSSVTKPLQVSLPPSDLEAKFYYTGLPSTPILVARTGPPWKAPRNPEVPLEPKELRPVGTHKLQEIWEDNLAFKLHALLDSMGVQSISTDVVRIWDTNTADPNSSPVILWIGVQPGSLSGVDGIVVASKSLDLLRQHHISDVEVEIRESVVTLLGSPRFLPFDLPSTPNLKIRQSLTTMVSLPISSQSTPWMEGSGGLFIAEEGKPERLLLITARHVVFKADMKHNEHFNSGENNGENNGEHNVVLFGDQAFKKYIQTIEDRIEEHSFTIDQMTQRLAVIQERDDPKANRERQRVQPLLDDEREAQEALKIFRQDMLTDWAPLKNRIIGHVILSPPLQPGFGDDFHTEDWAVIHIDASKVDIGNFEGNIINLDDANLSSYQITRMMNESDPDSPQTFVYPQDHCFRLSGTIPDEEIRKPMKVIKRGSTSGLTVGRANNFVSYQRFCFPDDDLFHWSKEWSILPYKSCAFSTRGDSGSVIVDGLGRICGLITSGNGRCQESPDITYATPIDFLLKRLRENGLQKPHVNPTFNPPVGVVSDS